MSISIKVSWNTKTGHVKGYDSKKNLIYMESFTAPTKRKFRELVREKIREYATVSSIKADVA